MFHGRPLNQSGVFQSQPQPQQQTPSWPLSQQDHNNLRASQSGTTPSVQVKFYLPDDEIRRSQISTNCTLQQVTEQIKRYASVADKDLLLAWNDDQNEWIRFDTDSEFNDAMNHARHLLAQSGVFKIQAKEGKTPKKQPTTTSSPVVVEQNPIQQQPPVVTQPPVQQPVQPPVIQRPPVTQSPIHQPPVTTQPPVTQPPVQPIVQRPPVTQPTNPFYPQPVQPQPPMMAYGTSPFQPQFTPMTMMAQPSGNMPVPRNASPFTATTTTTPTKTLTNSVTMQQPHPLNASFGSPNVVTPIQPSVTQSPVQQPPQTQQPQVDQNSLATLRSFGFPVHDSVLIKALQDANGDINVAAGKLLENN